MAAVSLFWDTNMAAMMSCENTLYTESVNYSAMVITSTRNEHRNINFHTDDVSLTRSECLWLLWGKFASTNQKHYPDLGSKRSSVWNFCSRFLVYISQGNQQWHHKILTVFLGYMRCFCSTVHFSIMIGWSIVPQDISCFWWGRHRWSAPESPVCPWWQLWAASRLCISYHDNKGCVIGRANNTR